MGIRNTNFDEISARMHRAEIIRPHSTPENAISVDDFITLKAEKVTWQSLQDLVTRLPEFRAKLRDPGATIHRDLVLGGNKLANFLERAAQGERIEPLPVILAEAAVAVQYVLKGADLIPDSIPEVGYVDDARIVARVVARMGPAL